MISKAALIAEIEKRKEKNREICTAEASGAYYEDGFILDIINSLEVKEVNLDRAIDKWIDDAAITHEDCSITDIKSTAKYFFELGLKEREGGISI